MLKALPAQSLLRERLYYQADQGILIWKAPDPQSRVKPGTEWGNPTVISQGSNSTKTYIQGNFQKTRYYGHRLIWRYVTGEDPGPLVVDHVDGDGLNNRFENLRLLTRSQNIAASNGHRRRKSDFKGVYARGKGWIAQARRNGVLYTAPGRYKSPEVAHLAYLELLTKLGDL